MSVAITMALTTAVIAGSQTHSTGTHVGPVIWQGVMMLLILPFGGLAFWAYTKQPISVYTDEQRKCQRFWRRIWISTLSAYFVIAVGLAVFLIKQGI